MSREINIDNYKSNNVQKLSNYSGLTVSEKIDLFERYLKENPNETIHYNTIFEGYNIGTFFIYIRYLMRNDLGGYSPEDLKRMEKLGLLEKAQGKVYEKVKNVKKFCKKYPYAFSNAHKLYQSLDEKEKIEFERVLKDYGYLRERKSRGKLSKKIEEELNNSQIGGVFKGAEIEEVCKEYGIKNKEKNQILKEFGSIENFRKAYIEYMVKMANAKDYTEIERIRGENKESAIENQQIPLVRNYYFGNQDLEKQRSILNIISYIYGEEYGYNMVMDSEIYVILERLLKENLTDKERQLVELRFRLKKEDEISKNVMEMSRPRVYRVMRDQVIRKMRRKEIREILFSYIYRPSEEFVRVYFSKMDIFENVRKQLSNKDREELVNMAERVGIETQEDSIEGMPIEDLDLSTSQLYRAMKYNGINTVGDLLKRVKCKKDLLTLAYVSDKDAEEIIKKLAEIGITIYNEVKKERNIVGIDIKTLNLSPRAYMVLARNEIHTVEQLLNRIKSKEDLLQIRWLGEGTANEIIEKLAENGITIYKDENEEAIKIALSKLRIQQEKMQELDANILYLKKQREVGEQLENQSKGEDDNGR